MSQNFNSPEQHSQVPGERVYRFVHKANDDPNDNSVVEFFIKEEDLSRDDINILFQELVRLFNFMPVQVQEGFVSYIDYTIAQEKVKFELGKTMDELDQMGASKLYIPPSGKIHRL